MAPDALTTARYTTLSLLEVARVSGRSMVEEDGPQPLSPSKTSFIDIYQQQLDTARRSSNGQMASAWRVISFFVVVFVLPTVLISLPLYARYHLYHARHLPMTETDTRALNHAVSSFWCQGQRVSSNGSLDAYLVSGAPRVKEERRHVTLSRSLILQHDDIEYWGVYLLQGSTFSISSTARWPGGVMLVVQGEENLRKCFYKEDLTDDLDDTNGAVHGESTDHGHEDGQTREDGADRIMDEERHWGEEEDNNGGEMFDDDLDVLRQKGDTEDGDRNRLDVPDDATLQGTHKYDLDGKLETKRKAKKGEMPPKKPEKSDPLHGLSRRSLTEDRQETDGRPADPSVPSDPEIQAAGFMTSATDTLTLGDKLDLLHQFNDTMLVEAGESSYSSSEEFMEQCRNAILMVDLMPYIHWRHHISNNDSSSPDSWTFAVNSSDYFYFIFTSDNSYEKNEIGFELDLQRITYDVSEPLETCRNATECVFPLAFTTTEAVVVEVPAEEHLEELHSFEVTTACQPRVPVYMVFILLVPFIILLFAFQ